MRLLFLIFLSILSLDLLASSFIPKNSLYFNSDDKSTGITEGQFREILKEVEDVYSPIVKNKNKVLELHYDWEDGTVNAYANQERERWVVHITGGIARHPAVTLDALTLVVCHELGHLMGGHPKFGGLRWASVEGQADYWAALKCARRVWEDDDNVSALSDIQVPQSVRDECSISFADDSKRNLCMRTAMGAYSLGILFQSLSSNPDGVISFDTPDTSVVYKTMKLHPKAQCRIDTFLQGAVCTVPYTEDVSKYNPDKGTCARYTGFRRGLRPRCWFDPSDL